jgi:hypothetical protein
MRRIIGKVCPVKVDTPCLEWEKTNEGFEQSCLACPVATHQTGAHPFLDIHVNIPQGMAFSIELV